MKLLIDGDALIYPILEACRSEAVDQTGELVWANLDLTEALSQVENNIERYMVAADTANAVVAFSCPSNECFRRDYSPTYKANRKGIKPLGFSPLIQRIDENWDTVRFPRLEADDILGILQTQPGTETMIVGVDKDFATVPGRVMHPGTLDIEEYSSAQADQNHLKQTLVGDSTDGYPGAKGWGPKKVEALGELDWGTVIGCFGNEYDALIQARLAKILRWEDWDGESKTVRHWCPK